MIIIVYNYAATPEELNEGPATDPLLVEAALYSLLYSTLLYSTILYYTVFYYILPYIHYTYYTILVEAVDVLEIQAPKQARVYVHIMCI